ncbi:hypothetical protein HN358_02950 [Candidatus Uhrbacteria bacterium]|jgi:vacuolar iron transporter family protein|nr:hypothetical protein [Candidatus Uhrbacteria bacterium]MBT7717159.1 hypothetical protein [Candidatus Uhrbacteria bacterium]
MKGGLKNRAGFFIREIVFGFEDSLVSTLGVVTGVAVGSQSQFVVALTGVVLVFVEGLSMAAGSYLSSKSAREVFEDRKRQDGARLLQERISDNESLEQALKRKKFTKDQINRIANVLTQERKLWMREVQRCEYRFAPAVSGSPVASGVVMGAFYLVGGIFPLLPYFFMPVMEAIVPSIIITGIVLFGLGVAKAKVVGGHVLKSGLEMTLISLSAAMVGYLLGRLVATYFGIDIY